MKHRAASLLPTCHKQGGRERQAELFPELEEAVRKGREELKQGVVWPDQDSEAYKNELCKRANEQSLFGPRLTPQATRNLCPEDSPVLLDGLLGARVSTTESGRIRSIHHSDSWSTTENPAAV